MKKASELLAGTAQDQRAKRSDSSAPAEPDGELVCPCCDGAGFVRRAGLPVDDPEHGKAHPCPCQPTELNRGLPPLFRGSTFDTFLVARNPAMQEAVDVCQAVAAGDRLHIVLYGDPGLGKTHLLAATIMAWRARGGRALFIECPELLATLRRNVASDAGDLDAEIDRLGSADILLGLDDLGAHNHTEWAEEQLFRILNRRYTNMAPTVITSNVVPHERIDARVRSRFSSYVVFCEGQDLR